MNRLADRVKGKAAISARELRAIWNQRLRPFWRLHLELYRALARRFLEQGDNYLASEVADEAEQFFGDDAPLILIRALATARSGAPQAAQEFLARKHSVVADAPEAKSLLARTFKDLWKSSGIRDYLQQSFDGYFLDYQTTKGDRTFPGVNAASMAFFLGNKEQARQIADDILSILRAKPDTANYWDKVTIAECQLVAGQVEAARASYHGAAHAGGIAHAHLATTRAQARLLLRHHGRAESEFDECFPLPNVIAFTGHRIDAPGRPVPRFPASQEGEIKEQIRQAVVASKAGFGYAAAASGADILFLEVMQEMGLETFVHLPLPEEDFIRESVADAGPAWLERYRKVTSQATEFTWASGKGPLAFDYGNRLLFGAARLQARQLDSDLLVLAVWDGAPSQGAGGTADYVALARGVGTPVQIIPVASPASSPAAATAPLDPGPHRLLATLSLTLPDEAAEEEIGALKTHTKALHCETAGRQIRLFFQDLATAAQAALAIADKLPITIGLHTGPVELRTHPITGQRSIRGNHALKADTLATLEPAGIIYASAPFAALLGLESLPEAHTEFLGYRSLARTAPREPIVRLTK